MPYLIKSLNGERRCSVIGNKTKKLSPREEIIEALKGLTLKLEINIVDLLENGSQPSVQVSMGNANDETIDQPTESTPTNHVPSPKLNNGPNMQLKVSAPAEVDVVRATSRSLTTEASKTQVKTEKPISRPEPIKQEPEFRMSTSVTANSDQIVSKVKPRPFNDFLDSAPRPVSRSEKLEKMMKIKSKVDKEPALPKPRLIKGEFEIGADVDTCFLYRLESSNPPTIFVPYDKEKLLSITELLEELTPEFEQLVEPSAINKDEMVVAKSTDDDTWYRSIVQKVEGPMVEIYFFDWGITEQLDLSRIRRFPHQGLDITENPACALKIQFDDPPAQALDDREFTIKVNTYDEYQELYQVTLVSIKSD